MATHPGSKAQTQKAQEPSPIEPSTEEELRGDVATDRTPGEPAREIPAKGATAPHESGYAPKLTRRGDEDAREEASEREREEPPREPT